MKIAFSARGAEPASRLEPHFGHARCLLVHDTGDGCWTAVEHRPPSGDRGAGIAAARHFLEFGVQAVVSGRMGPHLRQTLISAGIEVKRAGGCTVEEALRRYLQDELGDLVVDPDERCRWQGETPIDGTGGLTAGNHAHEYRKEIPSCQGWTEQGRRVQGPGRAGAAAIVRAA